VDLLRRSFCEISTTFGCWWHHFSRPLLKSQSRSWDLIVWGPLGNTISRYVGCFLWSLADMHAITSLVHVVIVTVGKMVLLVLLWWCSNSDSKHQVVWDRGGLQCFGSWFVGVKSWKLVQLLQSGIILENYAHVGRLANMLFVVVSLLLFQSCDD
jgi:hypothetical protein